MRPEIEEFARKLVECVRDRAIRDADGLADSNSKSAAAKRWRSEGVERVEVAIPDIIDRAVYRILHAIDNGDLRLQYVSDEGRVVDLANDGMGELAGWYMGGQDGWIQMLSKERFVDYFADLGGGSVSKKD